LFFFMYCVQWLKPIMSIYKPGVVFEIFLDDFILTKLNNFSDNEISAYQKSLRAVIYFLTSYCPENIKFIFTPSVSLFKSESHAWKEVDKAVEQWESPEKIKLSDLHKASIELSCRPTKEQLARPLWREENARLHDAYLDLTAKVYSDEIGKGISITPIPWSDGAALAIGTTKNSIMKHWVAVGVLKKEYDTFMPTVFSLSQLAKSKVEIKPIKIEGLNGKNFNLIRVIS